MKNKELLILFIVLCGVAISRLAMPWVNFSPIGAVALMGGAFIGRKALAFALPLLSLFLSDLVLSQVSPIYSGYLFSTSFLLVYAAFALTVIIGIRISKKLNFLGVLGGSVLAVALFFVLTNFGAWIANPVYPQNVAGLMTAMGAGVPFIKNALLSQVLFSSVLYFGWQWSTKRKIALA